MLKFVNQERLRAKACEELEAESIRANVLRHRLRALPTDVEGEFAAAVRAARQLNHDKIESLKEQLAAVTASIEAADARMAEIRFESSVLLYLYPVSFLWDSVPDSYPPIINYHSLRFVVKKETSFEKNTNAHLLSSTLACPWKQPAV